MMPIRTLEITLSKNEVVYNEKTKKWHYKELHRKITNHKHSQPWEDRANELRESGLKFREIADVLNDEGFISKQGNKISGHTIIQRLNYLKKRGSK
jgi:hypothetical protein